MDEIDWVYYKDEDFRNWVLGNILCFDDVDVKDYVVVYYVGGYGIMWDFLEVIDFGKVVL